MSVWSPTTNFAHSKKNLHCAGHTVPPETEEAGDLSVMQHVLSKDGLAH